MDDNGGTDAVMANPIRRPLVLSDDGVLRELSDGEAIACGVGTGVFALTPILGDRDRHARLHYEIQLAAEADFTETHSYRTDSENAQVAAAWRLLPATGEPLPFPADGVEAWSEWVPSDRGVPIRAPRGETGSFVLFDAYAVGEAGQRLYRMRAWDIHETAEGEDVVSEPGRWRYGVL